MISRRDLRRRRRARVAAWRAVPFRRRLEVLAAAKRGERHPDEAAVTAAQQYAEVCVQPGPGFWRSRRVTAVAGWIYLGLAVVIGVEAALAHVLLGIDGVSWLLGTVAVVSASWGLFQLDLHRECRRLLALPPR